MTQDGHVLFHCDVIKNKSSAIPRCTLYICFHVIRNRYSFKIKLYRFAAISMISLQAPSHSSQVTAAQLKIGEP